MKYCCLLFVWLLVVPAIAQHQIDTSESVDAAGIKDLGWVADSAYKVFRTGKFSGMRTFYQSYRTYKELIDTSAAGKQSEYTKFLMYQSQWNYLRIQFTKLMKKLGKAGIKWEKTVLDSVYYKKGQYRGLNYAYVYWILQYNNKRKHIVSAAAVEYNGNWYIMDELKYEGLVPEPSKKKKKKPLR